MHLNQRSLVRFAFAATLLVLAPAMTQSSTAITRAQTVPTMLDWPSFGNDLANTRFQDVDQVTPSNVSQLKPAWIFHTGILDENASFEVSPIVVNGTMYVTTGYDDVYALNAVTGAELWGYHALADGLPPFSQIKICCGRDNRGVAYGNGKVYVGRLDDIVVALNASTGGVVWHAKVADVSQGYAITMAPQFVDGLVIVGLSGGEFEVRGQVVAFNADTGQEVWRFFTTLPGPTWAGKSWQTGGATLWNTPAADPNLGLLYINTGNAGPDLNGIQRAGQNLYSSSVVALDIFTGQVKWYFQMVHHDLWDYDSAQPAMLFTVNGTPALGECSKNGNYYILNRATGQPIFPVTEKPVPSTMPAWQHAWPTQPTSAVEPLTPLSVEGPIPGFTVVPQYTPPSPDSPVMQPGDDGGCEWPAAAYSPRTQDVYYGTRYEPVFFQSFPNDTTDLGSNFSLATGGAGGDDHGIFGATNTTTGKVVWKIRVDQPAKSGLAVAGDLVFFGESNGRFHAVNAADGTVLWTFDGTSVPDGGGANANPSVYVSDGQEFVVNAFGGNAADRDEFGSPAGDALVAFFLPPAGYTGPNVINAH
jgi:PQQ-dependent dehydrogenase (methanol/ethanol family)